ncbi:MAG: hypothetical protein JW749_06130 [Sedimentisphaerales bacterium]|nr:hypothetical protein [Sedimentisphaerales bacterium]
MPRQIKNLFRPRYGLLGISVLFFGAAYLFLVFAIKTELIYYFFQMRSKSPNFRTGTEFLLDCISYPGGPAQYLAAFLTQLCFFPLLGSLFIILIAWGLYRFTGTLLNISPENPLQVVCYMPAFLILMKCGRYENPLFTGTALLIIVLVSVVYQKTSRRIGWLRLPLFVILTATFYYIAGSAVLTFVIIAALFELFERRKPAVSMAFLLTGAAVCWLSGEFLFRLDAGDSFLSLIHYVQVLQIVEQEKLSRFIDIALLAFFPVTVLIVNIIRRLIPKMRDSSLKNLSRKNKSLVSEEKKAEALGWLVQAALITIIGVPSVLFSFDRQVKKTLQVIFFTSRRMWPEALTIAREGFLKQYFPFCNNAVNRALFYTGRLGEEMFAFPQSLSDYDLVFNKEPQKNISYIERPELCLDLGMINAAETIAYNFLPPSNGNPCMLKQLAQINLVKGQIETAKMYLNALSRYPAYTKEAVNMLHNIEEDPLLERDRRIQSLREIMVEDEFAFSGFDEELWLKELLRKNKNNKMAFEYLMAHYLLERQLDKFVENLPRLDDLGYKNIPRHYQEAILVYKGVMQKDIDLGGREINTETVNQFNQISEIVNDPDNSNLKTLKRKLAPLAPKFGATYFFYYIFGSNEKT